MIQNTLFKVAKIEISQCFPFSTLPGLHPGKYVFMIKPQNL